MASIELRQYNIGSLDVYHTYVAFIKDNGELLAELHGDPYDRDTGEYSDPISAVFEGTQTVVADWSSLFPLGRHLHYAYDLHPDVPGT